MLRADVESFSDELVDNRSRRIDRALDFFAIEVRSEGF
jgi:hypothetical protein